MTSTTDEKIALLLSMGFDNSASIQALQICEGNVERAVESLLSGNITVGDTASSSNHTISSSSPLTIVQSQVSQYSDPRGRSACTAIALTQAWKCIDQLAANSPQRVITSTLLSESITDGIKLYSTITNSNSIGVEHLSVEDIRAGCLNMDNLMIPSLTLLTNSPRQGIRSRLSSNQHMGFDTLLSQCQRDATSSWIAVVITKTPETVLVILPTSSYTSQSSNPEFILIDSHPRPQQLAPHFPSGSYALFHPTLASLVASLEEIFPITELGDGVPELMQMMYNSFDLYPFQAPS